MGNININTLNVLLHENYNFSHQELHLIEHDGFIYWTGTIGKQFKTRCTFLSIKEDQFYLFSNDLEYKLKENDIEQYKTSQASLRRSEIIHK
ncbi:hypothetical protein C9J01_24065 [Photobacterium rosenbergii]|uniref:Uncharacterized protein n=1 Tax=Photobacterium rosenbergii TaxID=294936 RepID=A0A2T3N6K8_9GAMM|nr:hypothetical protein [Photobacterium rosenbergii]PSW08249.1 hypothetical protein C9J01_24065 [Photobacterium rosenbergii]